MIVFASIKSVYGSSVRDSGPIITYTLFWMLNGSVKIKIRENSKLNTISHITDLEKVFPDNEFLKDEASESNQ